MKVVQKWWLLLSLGLLLSPHASADQFHYQNILIGDRAIGMGGAFGAVADDATGIYYNPAGLGFALSNDVSGSANAFYAREATYKKALGDKDFVEESGGSTPSFFGGLQKLDNISKGLVAAFGVFTIDSDLKDQDNLIEDLQIGSTTLYRFHRTSNLRASSLFAGAGLAKRFGSSFSVGIAINYANASELVQEYQDVKQSKADENGNVFVQILTQNIRQKLNADGVQGVLGMQYAFGKFSAGLTIKGGAWLSQSMEVGVERRVAVISEADNTTLEENSQVTAAATLLQSTDTTKSDDPLGSMPTEARLGFAWFASPRLLWTFDVINYGEVKDAGTIPSFNKAVYEKEAVTNFATGVEYYLLPAMPLRAGVFTNNDARPQVEEGKAGQPDHVDFIGESLFLAWVQPNNQLTAGVILQQGSGKAQKLGDTQTQDIEASSATFAFAATASF